MDLSPDIRGTFGVNSRSYVCRQVSLIGFDNEPMARPAEQVLKGEEIPWFIRPLRGSSGLWGSAFDLHHDILVDEQDVERAQEALDLPLLDPGSARRQRMCWFRAERQFDISWLYSSDFGSFHHLEDC